MLDGNHRLDTLQAANLAIKLPYLDRWNEARRVIVERYRTALTSKGVQLPTIRAEAPSSHHLAIGQVPARDAVRHQLQAAGIATGIHYAIPCHQQPACAHLPRPVLPVVEAAAPRLLSLPLFPQLTEGEIERVIEALSAVLERDEAAPVAVAA